MGVATAITVDEYLASDAKPQPEFWDGLLIPRAMPTKLHQVLELLLVIALKQQGLQALNELIVKLAEDRFLVPDVVADDTLAEPFPVRPPRLCVEILSPSDSLGKLLTKCEQYHNWGVPHCWVIDPARQCAWLYEQNGEPQRTTETLVAGQITIDLRALFAEALSGKH